MKIPLISDPPDKRFFKLFFFGIIFEAVGAFNYAHDHRQVSMLYGALAVAVLLSGLIIYYSIIRGVIYGVTRFLRRPYYVGWQALAVGLVYIAMVAAMIFFSATSP